MKEKIKPNPQDTSTQDAEMVAESIQEEPKNATEVDFEDDYELAKKMSGNSDDTEEDASHSGESKPAAMK